MIAEKARFRHARRLERAAGFRIPDQAFHAATLEAVSSRINFDRLGHTLRENLVAFVHSFLDCRCRDSPLCGCPERRFTREILELRENGLDHRQISQYLIEEYGIDIYPADILSFLEDSVHVLEAVEDIARIENLPALATAAAEHIRKIER